MALTIVTITKDNPEGFNQYTTGNRTDAPSKKVGRMQWGKFHYDLHQHGVTAPHAHDVSGHRGGAYSSNGRLFSVTSHEHPLTKDITGGPQTESRTSRGETLVKPGLGKPGQRLVTPGKKVRGGGVTVTLTKDNPEGINQYTGSYTGKGPYGGNKHAHGGNSHVHSAGNVFHAHMGHTPSKPGAGPDPARFRVGKTPLR